MVGPVISGMALTGVRLPARQPGAGFPLDLPLLGGGGGTGSAGGVDIAFAPGVTVLVGENGSGKSTLLEAVALAAEVPTVGSNDDAHLDVTLAHLLPLADALRLTWTERSRRGLFLRAEDYFGYVQRQRRLVSDLRAEAARVGAEAAGQHEGERLRRMSPFAGSAAAMDARYQGDLDARSHGQSFLAFCKGRFTGPGLYLLDEPEAALSPTRQLAFLALLREAVARGAQFIIATHAPIVMAAPGALLLELQDGEMIPTAFDDLEHVRTLRSFLEQPDAYLRHL